MRKKKMKRRLTMKINNQNESFSKIMELKSWLTEQIKATPLCDFPVSTTFNDGLAEPIYKIIIEVEEQESYIDKKGVKWIRATTQ